MFFSSDKEVIDTLDNLQERLDNQLGMMEDGIEVMNDQMAVRLEVIDDRLETLGDIVEQQQIAGQCSNAMTGSFHNPAHNCSHIALLNPNATSGRGYHCQCFNLCPIAILFSP